MGNALRESFTALPAGAADRVRLVDPPMNRWAMIGCPCRDKEELAAKANAFCV